MTETQLDQQPKEKKSNVRLIVIAVVALAIVIAAIVAVVFIKGNAEADRLAHQKYPVSFSVDIEGYDPATSTPIPVSVRGSDFEGTEVVESFLYTSSDGATVDVPRGEYTITVLASPITVDGGMYSLTAPSTQLRVVDATAEEELRSTGHADKIGKVSAADDASSGAESSVVLVKVDPADVTDEMIYASERQLEDLGFDASKFAPFKDAVLAARAKAEADRAAAAAELLAQQTHYGDETISISVPASWADHWMVDKKIVHSIQGGQIPNAFRYTFTSTVNPSESFQVQVDYAGCYLVNDDSWDGDNSQLAHAHFKNGGLAPEDYANVRSSLEIANA